MAAGVHYAEFTLITKSRYGSLANVGVVGAGVDTVGGGRADFSAKGWVLWTTTGTLLNNFSRTSKWKGMPQPFVAPTDEVKEGDVVGLLLDLGQRTLSVVLNGSWRGVMVAPGMRDSDGDTLSAPLRWAVGLGEGVSVRIKRGPMPPPPAEAQVAAAVAWNVDEYWTGQTRSFD